MKKYLFRICLMLSLVFTMFPATAFAEEMGLTTPGMYVQVKRVSEAKRDAPYRLTPGGDIQGSIPMRIAVEVTGIQGDWGKIKYNGGEYYIWGGHFKRIGDAGTDAPGTPRMSAGVKPLLMAHEAASRAGGMTIFTERMGDDWTKPITRYQMAETLVGMMSGRYDSGIVGMTLPIVKTETEGQFPDIEYDFSVSRLALWGVIEGASAGDFHPNANVTREQMVNYLFKLVEYDRVNNIEDSRVSSGKGDFAMKAGSLDGFSDAGQISSWARDAMSKMVGEGIITGTDGRLDPKGLCTIEETQIMCDRLSAWIDAKELQVYAGREADAKYTQNIVSGKYTIQSDLGGKPYLYINAEGKTELSAANSTVFNVTYLRTEFDFIAPHIYTIQAPDGRYVGLTDTNAVNGSRLQLIGTPYEWTTSRTGPWSQLIYPANNRNQMVNASGFNTSDGTPVITWYIDASEDRSNGHFLFTKVK